MTHELTIGCVVKSKVTLALCAITRGDVATITAYEPGFSDVLTAERATGGFVFLARGDVNHLSDCENY